MPLRLPRWPLPVRLGGLVLLRRGLTFRPELSGHLYAIQHGVLGGMYSLWKTGMPCKRPYKRRYQNDPYLLG